MRFVMPNGQDIRIKMSEKLISEEAKKVPEISIEEQETSAGQKSNEVQNHDNSSIQQSSASSGAKNFARNAQTFNFNKFMGPASSSSKKVNEKLEVPKALPPVVV